MTNHIIAQVYASVTPEIGMGCTILSYSDRHACTVIDVSKTGKTITIQEDLAERTDKHGMSEVQSYTYTPNPEGRTYIARRRGNGHFKIVNDGRVVMVGKREEYYDFSF